MKKRVKSKFVGRTKSHRKSLRHNLVQELIEHGLVVTTVSKAKALKHDFDKFISLMQRENIDEQAKKRRAQAFLTTNEAVDKLFEEVLPQCTGRIGGYTTFGRVGERSGDGAPRAFVKLLPPIKKDGKARKKSK